MTLRKTAKEMGISLKISFMLVLTKEDIKEMKLFVNTEMEV